eukprot:gb/GEZN01003094.1/.p1 GENE.gb/GEZN01003094.1/~~gb/GEZN01003094.1/.p1  ORF type:complete len:657 (+),score=72.79 gb/GEZN01003094.1/:32-2002(+)
MHMGMLFIAGVLCHLFQQVAAQADDGETGARTARTVPDGIDEPTSLPSTHVDTDTDTDETSTQLMGKWAMYDRDAATATETAKFAATAVEETAQQTSQSTSTGNILMTDTARITALENQVNYLTRLTLVLARCVPEYNSKTPDDFIISNCNLHVRSGMGSTSTAPNGLGNVIVGYNEGSAAKTGSHNVVIGPQHTYTSYGGIVTGDFNQILAPYAAVVAGQRNIASGVASAVVAGEANCASGPQSSVTGGRDNKARGMQASVSGGDSNRAVGDGSSVLGGFFNTAAGLDSTTGGGSLNIAIGMDSSVSAGVSNTAYGEESSVSGGRKNLAKGYSSSCQGGSENNATGNYSSITGGKENWAVSDWSAILGGFRNKAINNGTNPAAIIGRRRLTAADDFIQISCKDNRTITTSGTGDCGGEGTGTTFALGPLFSNFERYLDKFVGFCNHFIAHGTTGVSIAPNSAGSFLVGDVGTGTPNTLNGSFAGLIPNPFNVFDKNEFITTVCQSQKRMIFRDLNLQPGIMMLPSMAFTMAMNLKPSVYFTDTLMFPSTITLSLDGNGDSNSVFVFKVNSLSTLPGSALTLINKAQSNNVFWIVNGTAAINGNYFAGNIIAQGSITLGNELRFSGRALSVNGNVIIGSNTSITLPYLNYNGGSNI